MNIPYNLSNLAYWAHIGLTKMVADGEINENVVTTDELLAQSLRDAGYPHLTATDVAALVDKRQKKAEVNKSQDPANHPHASSIEGFNQGFSGEFDTRTQQAVSVNPAEPKDA